MNSNWSVGRSSSSCPNNDDDDAFDMAIDEAAIDNGKDESILMIGVYCTASKYQRLSIPKVPMHTSAFTGFRWVSELMEGSEERFE
ncbi:hypothetical protein U1Q18_006998 [Sarracenia purpurea var. burkii]